MNGASRSPGVLSPVNGVAPAATPGTPATPGTQFTSEFQEWLHRKTAERKQLLARVSRIIEARKASRSPGSESEDRGRMQGEVNEAAVRAAASISPSYRPYYTSMVSSRGGTPGLDAKENISVGSGVDGMSHRGCELSLSPIRAADASRGTDEVSLESSEASFRLARLSRSGSGAYPTSVSQSSVFTEPVESSVLVSASKDILVVISPESRAKTQALRDENEALRARVAALEAQVGAAASPGSVDRSRTVIKNLSEQVAALAAEAEEQAELAALAQSQVETLTNEKLSLFVEVAQGRQAVLVAEEENAALQAQLAAALRDAQTGDATATATAADAAADSASAARIAVLEAKCREYEGMLQWLREVVALLRQPQFDQFVIADALESVADVSMSRDDDDDGDVSGYL
ncbi:uncharacterized protein AMSG_06280 [Thecamonas trahens ATCC 50062]|uniref:Uncharacterized protein n=1 Tax=Thecamonas trahens ATCC 50062 TaxID=461836 RepID=A0A0L0DCU5_THETB|nr:hypothetical protein AMSG_06280 [Thecamonas trahens ATCC 50062]KNC50144.1 hypothetical protein AMSG_06280 [Thecamonas trahens ATCC 50062]|eukprot:XP_013756992.1 hypothetical protein AMSG_06280 [Thecamonas trahens ATCC 50062]